MKTQLFYSLLAISAAVANPIEATAQGNIMRRGEPYTRCVASDTTERIREAAQKVPEATKELKQFSECILRGVNEHADNESAKRRNQFLENFSSCANDLQENLQSDGVSDEDTMVVLEELGSAKKKILDGREEVGCDNDV